MMKPGALIQKGINPISFAGLKVSVSAEESKAINFDASPKVILSASGMCDAGRIKHHLKHNLWRRESTILFVGYQAVGSLGRQILEGAETVKLFGETIEVKAEIARLAGVSGHADKEGLLTWIGHFSPKPQRVFVVHGDDAVCEAFTAELTSRGFSAVAPIRAAALIWPPTSALSPRGRCRSRRIMLPARAQSTFTRLLAAGKRLLTVIEHNKGGTNKDLARFASQIDSLCDKWDR